ncbi:hypothetical protein [Sphingomonas sp. ERG5]|uniref:hypothetical protein n=1 Tax=Sphingomonas sp. ERG5 TaxID=1381597 RepID=UPI001269D6DA|nr:hypothetical protein [Sphingomonas sp. ERG5]
MSVFLAALMALGGGVDALPVRFEIRPSGILQAGVRFLSPAEDVVVLNSDTKKHYEIARPRIIASGGVNLASYKEVCARPEKSPSALKRLFDFSNFAIDKNFKFASNPDCICWRRAKILHLNFNSELVAIALTGHFFGRNVSTQFGAGNPPSFKEGPSDKGGADQGENGDKKSQPHVGARQPVGFHDLIYSGPLSAQISIFVILRIIAIGLIAFGIRLTGKDDGAALLAGWLIMIAGALLLAGIVELVAGVS